MSAAAEDLAAIVLKADSASGTPVRLADVARSSSAPMSAAASANSTPVVRRSAHRRQTRRADALATIRTSRPVSPNCCPGAARRGLDPVGL